MTFRTELCVLPLLIVVLAGVAALGSEDPVLRFDMGTESSPVGQGFRRVTAETEYSAETGYGWVGDPAAREAFCRESISDAVMWRAPPPSDVIDGVASPDDLVFQIDVPNGLYAIEIHLGDLGGSIPAGQGRFLDTGVRGEASGGPGGPLYSMAVDSGHRRVATDVAARTYPHRGMAAGAALVEELGLRHPPVVTRLGNWAAVRFHEAVTDGRIVMRFHGDETTYRTVVEQLRGITDERRQRQALHAAGGPFTKNSVLSIVVRPALAPPFVMSGGRLELARGDNPAHTRFIAAMGAERFSEADRAIQSFPRQAFADDQAWILARMWLAGHPNHWRERELLAGLAAEIDRSANRPARTPAELAELQSLRDMLADFQQGIADFDQRTRDGQEVVTCMNRAEASFARALDGEPFYWKSRLYQARIWYSMDPNRNAQLWPRARDIMATLEAHFPGNRWVRYYLHQDPAGWPVTDYRERTRGAPAWAAESHNFYNRMLDLCEWWIEHRQNDDGALGGEWGDDVEFMPLITYTALVCPDAGPRLVDGTMRFSDGLWHRSGIVDPHNGFFHITSDAEHAAEFTGNVLGMMIHLRPGDPEFVERSLKTGKLMRDVWTGRNQHGQRLFRSSYLGAFGASSGDAAEVEVDAAICGRALNPVWNVLELNRNPELARLAIEYADTLVELALSTRNGKPRGVLPGPIVYDTGEPGSGAWWQAPPGPYQGMFSFPSYHGFRLQAVIRAWRLTGDPRYLEPIRLEAEFVEAHYPRADRELDAARERELAQAAPEERQARRQQQDAYRAGPHAGSAEWTARLLAGTGVVELWQELQAEMGPSDPAEAGLLVHTDHVAAEARRLADVARVRWPMMTDDATMTDRVAFPGCVNSCLWYCGARIVAQQLVPAVTYEGAGRDFAALVQRHNPKYVRILYYGFHDHPRRVMLRFWELEPQGVYRLRGGPDDDQDGIADEMTMDTRFTLSEPSGGVELVFPPGRTHALEVTQVAPGEPLSSVADLAIAARDIRYDPRGHLLVDVHNIGNAAADDVEVRFYDGDPDTGGTLMGRTTVSHIEPPNTLVPQVVRIGVEWSPADGPQRVTVVLDPRNRVRELFKRNNRATAVIVRPD